MYVIGERINGMFKKVAQAIREQDKKAIQDIALAQVKAGRNRAEVEAALAEVDRATSDGTNVVPSVLKAVRAYATVGEIVERWRKRFGSFAPSTEF